MTLLDAPRPRTGASRTATPRTARSKTGTARTSDRRTPRARSTTSRPSRPGEGTPARRSAATAPSKGGRSRSASTSTKTAAPRTRRSRIGTGAFVALMGTLLTAGLLVMLLVNTFLAQGAFRVSELTRQAAELQQREQQLAQLLALEENPGRLEQRARALGMVPQDVPAFLRLSDGAILGDPRPQPEPVTALPVDAGALLTDPGVGVDPAAGTQATGEVDPAGAAVATDPAAVDTPPATGSDAPAGTADSTGPADTSSTWTPWTGGGVAP